MDKSTTVQNRGRPEPVDDSRGADTPTSGPITSAVTSAGMQDDILKNPLLALNPNLSEDQDLDMNINQDIHHEDTNPNQDQQSTTTDPNKGQITIDPQTGQVILPAGQVLVKTNQGFYTLATIDPVSQAIILSEEAYGQHNVTQVTLTTQVAPATQVAPDTPVQHNTTRDEKTNQGNPEKEPPEDKEANASPEASLQEEREKEVSDGEIPEDIDNVNQVGHQDHEQEQDEQYYDDQQYYEEEYDRPYYDSSGFEDIPPVYKQHMQRVDNKIDRLSHIVERLVDHES